MTAMALSADEADTREERTEVCLPCPASPRAPALVPYAAGSVLSGKYRLDVLLGEGGMAAVWRATNLLLDLPVAIKLIRADLDQNGLRARLRLEARSVARLGHPAIVRVYDVGETQFGDPFIVMELLQGQTLAELLTLGPLPSVQAVQLLLPIIDACAVAHVRGIVHRDLKPENLFIARDEQRLQPKILDFGIARLIDPQGAEPRLTEFGTVLGSPEYMSPEQARGSEDVDHSTDIWSLCVVLYEAITHAAPFGAANYNALVRAIVEDEPKSLRDHSLDDAELWAILKGGLAKSKHDRPRSMTVLGRSLARWLRERGIQEDACGTALESKWLGTPSDPSALAQVIAQRPINCDPLLRGAVRARGSEVAARGQFTATIGALAAKRAQGVRAAAAGLALGGLALAFVFAPRAPFTDRRSAELAPYGVRRASAPPPTAQEPIGGPTLTPGAALALAVIEPRSSDPPSPTLLTKATSVGARAELTAPQPRAERKQNANAARRVDSAPSPARAAPTTGRELDLIAPY